jgi:hypothetical protein
MTVVAFVYADWSLRYPEFSATVSSPQASDSFLQATLYLDNTDGSIVQDIPTRTMLLYMLTAHIAQLGYGSSGQTVSPLVGRIDSATQGSVSVSAKMAEGIGIAAWLQQTKYGTSYWAATARYRMATYVAPRRRRAFP